MLDYYSVSGCYILKPWSYSIWEEIQGNASFSLNLTIDMVVGFLSCLTHFCLGWFNAKIKEMDVQNSYFPMFVSAKVLEREKDHIEGFSPEVAWVTRAYGSIIPFVIHDPSPSS